jgi:hypothetical protein
MHGNVVAILGDNVFRLYVEALSDFTWTSFPQPAFPAYMRRQLDRIAGCKGLKAGIERARRAAQLHVKRTCQKERTQREACTEPLPSSQEVQPCGEECRPGRYPPRERTTEVSAGDYPRRIGQRGPEHWLPRGLDLKFRRKNWQLLVMGKGRHWLVWRWRG